MNFYILDQPLSLWTVRLNLQLYFAKDCSVFLFIGLPSLWLFHLVADCSVLKLLICLVSELLLIITLYV